MTSDHLTVGQVATIFGVGDQRARRVVDAIAADLPRAGQYRLIPRSMLGAIAVELTRRGWLPPAADSTSPASQATEPALA